MKCRNVQKLLADLLISPAPQPGKDLLEHLASCPECSRIHEQNRRIVGMLKPKDTFRVSPGFEERVMNDLAALPAGSPEKERKQRSRKIIWIPAAAAAALVLLFLGLPHLLRYAPLGVEQKAMHPLVSLAMAAERDILGQGGIVHFVKEVTFHPVRDSLLAKMRLHFLPLIGADGKMIFSQLTLPDDAARGFTVHEDSWFDQPSKRFALIVRVDGKPVFVNSFDGKVVRTTEPAEGGGLKIVEQEVSGAFAWPKELNESVGVSGDVEKMLESFDEENISEAGEGTLGDGTPVRLVKALTVGPDGKPISSCLIKIRRADNTFAEMEFTLREETAITMRFAYHRPVAESSVPWSLGQIDSLEQIPGARMDFDMMKPDVSVRQMLDNVDFPAYLIQPDPPWTTERKVSVVNMNIPGMNRKTSLCIAAYRGGDGRHLVLAQSDMYFHIASAITAEGTKIYTSPGGFQVWSNPKDAWLAKNNLSAARGVITDIGRPAEDCSGCTIITPDGPVLMLAVNGRLSDDELHKLVDNLVLVDEFFGRQALESGVIDAAGESGRLALVAAVGLGREDKVKELLAAGADPNASNPGSGMNALWLACARGRTSLVKTLLEAGARVSGEKPSDNIPLFRAAEGGHTGVVKLLLEAGAGVDAPNRDGLTPLFFAAARGDSAMVGTLLAAGADPEAANDDRVTSLMMAAKRGRTGVVKALIAAGADVNAADKDGKPLLMHAVDLGEYVEVVKILIAAGVNVNAALPNGWTVLQHAKDKGRTGVVALLEQAGAKE